MDPHTLELLEFGKLREQVAARCGSAPGKRLAAAIAPMSDLETIREALALTTEVVEATDARLVPSLGGLRDVEPHVKRAGLGVLLEIEPLQDLREAFELSGRAADHARTPAADGER